MTLISLALFTRADLACPTPGARDRGLRIRRRRCRSEGEVRPVFRDFAAIAAGDNGQARFDPGDQCDPRRDIDPRTGSGAGAQLQFAEQPRT